MRLHVCRLIGAVSLLAATSLGIASAQAPDGQPISLGAVYGLTGAWSAFDVPSSRGAELMIKTVNAKGGVRGRPIKLVIRDTGSSGDKTSELVESMLADDTKVPAVFGLSASDPVLIAGKVAAAEKRVFLTSGATSPKLPMQVPTYLFLACFGDNVQAAAAAEYAYTKLGARSASVAYDKGHTYTRLLHGYFQTAFEGLGGEVRSVAAFDGPADLGARLDEIADADIIFLATETPPNSFAAVKTLRSSGFDQPIVGGDGYDGEEVWRQDTSLKDIYYSTHAFFGVENPSPLARAFREKYMATYGNVEPSAFAGLGYDAAGLLAAAIGRAGSAAPEDVLQALSTLQNYDGVTGKISFVGGSRIPKKSVTILRVDDGQRRFVEEIIPTDVPAP